jgi:hypothetical protein
MHTTNGTGRGSWLVITDETVAAFRTSDDAEDAARDVSEQLDCPVIMLDRTTGETWRVTPHATTRTIAGVTL